MNTAEMWLQAQKDNKAYCEKNGYIAYQKNMGFFNIIDGEEFSFIELDRFDKNRTLDYFMNIFWDTVPYSDEPIITKREAEIKYKIKIIG